MGSILSNMLLGSFQYKCLVCIDNSMWNYNAAGINNKLSFEVICKAEAQITY